MTNENCLEGMRCPQCKQEDEFLITATVTATVLDDGVADSVDPMWDEDSAMSCNAFGCGFSGVVREFCEVNWGTVDE